MKRSLQAKRTLLERAVTERDAAVASNRDLSARLGDMERMYEAACAAIVELHYALKLAGDEIRQQLADDDTLITTPAEERMLLTGTPAPDEQAAKKRMMRRV